MARGAADSHPKVSATVWAACGLAGTDPVYDGWSAIGVALARRGVRLKLWVREPDLARREGFETAYAPHFVSDGESGDARAADPSIAAEIGALERAWYCPNPEIDARVLAATGAWAERLAADRPVAIVSWGDASPTSRLLVRLAQKARIVCWRAERGPLPGTLDLSSQGQSRHVALATETAMLSGDRRALNRRFERVRAFYDRPDHKHYPEHNRDPEPADAERLLAGDGPKVLFLGAVDVGSGLRLQDLSLGDRVSAFVRGTDHASAVTIRALEKARPDAVLWHRPHPGHAVGPAVETALDVRDAQGLDLNWLIRRADVVVSAVTTSQIEAALYDVPQVLLGAGPLIGRGVGYEAFSEREAVRALKAALARRGFEAKKRAARQTIGLLFDRHLIGLRPEVPTRLGPEDAAELIGRFARFRDWTPTAPSGQ